VKVLVLCFANTCRSPVCEAVLARALTGSGIEISSKGLAGGSGETPGPLSEVLARRGLTLVSPSGQRLDLDEARGSDLLLFMERSLLREAVVAEPALWNKSFTLSEFARRGWTNPPEPERESFAQWLAVVHAGRRREDMFGDANGDDVGDPGLSGTVEQFEAMVDEIEVASSKVARLLISWSAR
jgi:protein-tyrosine phosphatase